MKKFLRIWLIKFLKLDELKADVIDLEVEVGKMEALTSDLVNIGVDVHFDHPHMVLIYSRLNGGQLRHIDVDLKNVYELNGMVQDIKARYRTKRDTWDLPPGHKNRFM